MDISSAVVNYSSTHSWGNLFCAALAIEATARSVCSFAEGIFFHFDNFQNPVPAVHDRSIACYRNSGRELVNAAVFFIGTLGPWGGVLVPLGMIIHDRMIADNAAAAGILPAPGGIIYQRYYVSRLASWAFTPLSHVLSGVVEGVADVCGVSARTASVAVLIIFFMTTVVTLGTVPVVTPLII